MYDLFEADTYSLKVAIKFCKNWDKRLYKSKPELENKNKPKQFGSSVCYAAKGTGSRFGACSFIKMLFFCPEMLYHLREQYDHVR